MADRVFAVESAGFWHRSARLAQDRGDMREALLCMENAFNHTENALFAARRAPKPSKLWAETTTARCCSAASPCDHQKRWPGTVCDTCHTACQPKAARAQG